MLQLRPASPADFEFVYTLYFHPATNPYLLYEPMSREAFAPIFDELIHQGLKYVAEVHDEPVGMVKLIRQTHRVSCTCYMGGFAVHPQFFGKGYGLQMLEAVKHWAAARGITRVELDVDDDNARAKALYEKAGFEVEGILRKLAYRKTDGRYYDNYRMAVLLQDSSV